MFNKDLKGPEHAVFNKDLKGPEHVVFNKDLKGPEHVVFAYFSDSILNPGFNKRERG